MRRNYFMAGIFAAAVLLSASCNKEPAMAPQAVTNNQQNNNQNNQNSNQPDKKAMLAGTIQKTWHISKVLSGGMDMTNAYQACTLDDNYVYSADGNFEENEGASSCNTMDPQLKATGTWEFNEDKTKLITKTSKGTMTDNILELTSAKLRIGGTYNGTAWEIDYTTQ